MVYYNNILSFTVVIWQRVNALHTAQLWKSFTDKSMTKTQMCIAAGISINVLAKMGKNEPVAIDNLAKVATALQCRLDDIVGIQEERKV